jgi:transposase
MPWSAAAKIEISEKEEAILNQLSVGTHTPLHLKTRAKIILMASQGQSNNAIRVKMTLRHETVKLWRDRYINISAELKQIEADVPHKLRRTIEAVLSDEQRPGAPSKFGDEQVAAIIAMACEDPSVFDLPFSHWTPELLQIEAIKLGIVDSISVRQVGRFLKGEGFKAASKPMLAEPKNR